MTKRLRQSFSWIIGFAALGLALGVVLTFVMPQKYDASVSFDVQRINKQSTAEYQYDGYYEIQASDLFSQTVISWFLTPSILFEIYEEADVSPEIATIAEFSKRFTARKYSPQNIVVSFSETTETRATNLGKAMVTIVETRSKDLNKTEDNQALFEIKGATPVIVEHEYSLLLYGLVGAIIGGLLGVAVLSYRRGIE